MTNRFTVATLLMAMTLLTMTGQHAHAHALLYDVVTGEAVTLQLHFPDDNRPLFEPYQVFAPDSERAFQVGRVNAIGEVTFRPDRAGTWRIEVTSADGHGAQARVVVDEVLAVTSATSHQGWWTRTLAGLGWLLGIFGILALWRLRRTGTDGG